MRKAFGIALTALLIGASPLPEEPFGVAPVEAPGDKITSMIWRGLQRDMQADERVVTKCRADPACGSPAALRFIAIVDEAKQYQGRALLGHLNRAVNVAIPWTRSGAPWQSPLEALASRGDCKSYAVTKYAALGAAGIAPNDRRLVEVWDNARPLQTHLVVVVRVEQHWLILDNQTMSLVESTHKSSYQPLHVLDQSGVRDFPPLAPAGGPL
jgi:predicted transglutaminase-like cysteine proteinase